MTDTATVTSKGQVTIPKRVRDRLGLEPGQTVSFIVTDGEARLVPTADDPMEELRSLREEIRFGREELDEMLAESKRAWSTLDPDA
jgi:AbrB family looped-hinge helix DNA binding protein